MLMVTFSGKRTYETVDRMVDEEESSVTLERITVLLNTAKKGKKWC